MCQIKVFSSDAKPIKNNDGSSSGFQWVLTIGLKALNSLFTLEHILFSKETGQQHGLPLLIFKCRKPTIKPKLIAEQLHVKSISDKRLNTTHLFL